MPEPDYADLETALSPWLQCGHTIAFVGSSGVGKSTLINCILGAERQRTASISRDVGKGRHITVRRELLITPTGALVIDTPGLRELQLWPVGSGALDATFADIAALASRCRFHDCAHTGEPGCAVASALKDGSLDAARWQSYRKLQREEAYAAREADPRLERQHRAAWRKVHLQHRDHLRWEKDNA